MRTYRSTRHVVDGPESINDSLRLSTCAGNILWDGSRATAPTRCSTYVRHVEARLVWRQCLSCNWPRGQRRWCTDANPQQAQFYARSSGGRDESASHMTAELCKCTCECHGLARAGGTYRETFTANPKRAVYCSSRWGSVTQITRHVSTFAPPPPHAAPPPPHLRSIA